MIENRKTKKCSICHFYKPFKYFDVSCGRLFNRRSECKSCRAKHRTDINTQAVIKAKEKYRKTTKGKVKEKAYNNSERHKHSVLRWKKANKHKLAAHTAALRAHPKISPCKQCSSTKNVQRHHPDYKHPKTIIWLCASCHRSIHTASLKKFKKV
jgi:hypothetical protein